ncbi:MAG: glycosyltransferase family 4 protein [Coleofasciculaceae cyanobacterium SM2_1_6]|nr:glycosyltransferase family 4 protein [Coleofasciculaceae cyanobacterium SM2_1_6]
MNNTRIAWLIPSVELGAYWQPVLAAFAQVFPKSIFYTGLVWPGFDPTLPGNDTIQIVGEMKSLEITKTEGYSRRVMLVSPSIIGDLWKFKPQVVLAQAYSLWTLIAVLLKPILGWKLIIIYDGSSPNSDFEDSLVRSIARKFMSSFAEAFIPNSYGAREYLIRSLGAKPNKVFTHTYLVPDAQTLLQNSTGEAPPLPAQRPIFLYVGRITARKGIKPLIEACAILKKQGYTGYSLVVIGNGDQRGELEELIAQQGLTDLVTWVGWVEYGSLGVYFQNADVFVFPTLEDIWGMVPLEAMVFGTAVLCSRWAGAAELVVDGESGYIFDPYKPEELAEKMRQFLDRPELIKIMGDRAKEHIGKTNYQTAADGFIEVINRVIN